MRAPKLFCVILAAIFTRVAPASAQTFVDWTNVDTALGTATGTLASALVTINGPCGLTGPVPCGLVDANGVNGGFTGFSSSALFTTPVASTDYVGFVGAPGNGPPYVYDVSFSAPVTDPVILIENLASTLVFSLPAGSSLTRLSGDPTIDTRTFTVTGTTVVGTLVDCPQPCRVDAAGELQITGTVSGFSFTARYDTIGSSGTQVDGINLQIGGTVAPPVDAGVSDDASTDAGPTDAGPADAGPPDAGEPDAGQPDAGPPVDSGQPVDAGVADIGVPGPDAATRPDTGAITSDAGIITEEEEGCGCSSTQEGIASWPALALPLLALSRRRRNNNAAPRQR